MLLSCDLFHLLFLATFELAFDLGDFWCWWEILWDDTTRDERIPHGFVVGDVLDGDRSLAVHALFTSVVDGDLGREVLGFEEDGRHEFSNWLAVCFPADFHLSRIFPTEKRRISFAAYERKIFITACLTVDQTGELFLGFREFFTSLDSISAILSAMSSA